MHNLALLSTVETVYNILIYELLKRDNVVRVARGVHGDFPSDYYV